jgi:hypothetical protein
VVEVRENKRIMRKKKAEVEAIEVLEDVEEEMSK